MPLLFADKKIKPGGINLINTTKQKYPTGFKTDIYYYVKKILKLYRIKRAELSIVLVDNAQIKKLNKLYRHQDKATDVLSFTYDNTKGQLIGDIVISLAVSRREAKDQGLSHQQMLNKLLVHGLVHLLGYDHITDRQWRAMEVVEQTILTK